MRVLLVVAYGVEKGDYHEPDPLMRRVLDKGRKEYDRLSLQEEEVVILITAGRDPNRSEKAERDIVLAEIYKDHLCRAGVPAGAIIVQPATRFHTDGEMEAAAGWLASQESSTEVQEVLLCNKSWHLPRTSALFWIHRRRLGVKAPVRWISVPDKNRRKILRETGKFLRDLARLAWRLVLRPLICPIWRMIRYNFIRLIRRISKKT